MKSVTQAVALAAVTFAVVGCGHAASVRATGTLKVTVIADGGPPLPDGGTRQALMTGATVRVTPADGGGATESADTDKAGVAVFLLPGGSYAVSSPTCGVESPVKVTVTSSRLTPLTWVCPVP